MGDEASELAEHVQANREHWDAYAPEWVEAGERNWARPPGEEVWGNWGVPQSELPLLPDDLDGLDAIELGCGTGYGSAWMARRGARRVVGVDNSAQQLATARRLLEQHPLPIDFLHGDAEHLPHEDGSFDFALSEYGASIWCDPYVWLPEAHRVLRPGGRLVFLGTHPLLMAVQPLDGSLPKPTPRELVRPWFGSHGFDWRDADDEPGGYEFNLSLHDWFALFRDVGFRVDHYQEPRPTTQSAEKGVATLDWARAWPTEQVFHLTRV